MTDQHVQHCVLEGCAPSAQVAPDMTVAISAGSVLNSNAPASVAAQNATITAAHATLDRWDLISVSSTGTVTVTAGTPADVPVQPDDTDVPLAHVYVYSQANASYTGTIVSGVIQDTRGFGLIHTSPYHVSNLLYGPMWDGQSTASFSSTQNSRMYLVPFFVGKSLPIKAVGIMRGTGTGAASSVARLGIYSDDGTGGLSLLVDAGTVPLDSGASTFQTINTSQTLAPGVWWFACALQGLTSGTPSLSITGKTQFGFSPIGIPSPPVSGLQSGVGAMRFSSITGALPASPSSPVYSDISVPMVWVQAT